ncbi:MAG: hypothetical protein ACI4AH_05210 [Muribaculaceae bacterium]
MKQIQFIIIAIASFALASCSSDSFRLEARIEGLGTQNVHIVYATSEGVQSDWITAENNRLTYEGYAPELTVLQVLDGNDQLIARMAVKNGDKLKFRGPLNDPMAIEFKGSDVSEQWSSFLKENIELVNGGNQPMLDIAIEKYIRENPDNVVSTLLLLFDYGSLNDTKAIDKMLDGINDNAKPLFLLSTYQMLRNERNKDETNSHFFMFDLYESTGKWSTFRANGHSFSMLWLWSRDDAKHRATADSIKQLTKTYGKRLQVADVFVDGDTTVWRSTFKADSTNWTHFWAPGGPKSKYLSSLNTFTTPKYLLVDSLGIYHYRGESIAELTKALKDSDKKRLEKKKK